MNTRLHYRRVAVAVLAFLASVGCSLSELQAQSNVAVVHRLMLDAEMAIIPTDDVERVARLADLLNHNDLIVTSPNTRAAVRFTDDGSLLRVNPSSQVQIRAEGETGSITKTLELEFGELWARVQRRDGQEFQVQTPSGVAAVRGTEFIVQVGPDGQTTVITLEGLLDFFNDTGTIQVPEGFRAQAATAADTPTVAPTEAEDLRSYAGLVEDDDGQTGDVEVRIPGTDGQGRATTLVLQIPRSEIIRVLGTLP